jgi:DNA-binding SARP family transcriptional activator
VEVYSRCRKTLAARLAVEPSPETRAIYQKLLAAQ